MKLFFIAHQFFLLREVFTCVFTFIPVISLAPSLTYQLADIIYDQ